MWIDAYNNTIHRETATTITTRVDAGNSWFLNDPRNRDETDSDKPNERRCEHD